MKEQFVSFGKIPQFRNVIRDISHAARFNGFDDKGEIIYNVEKLPEVEFIGTTKLHGTNAGITMINGEFNPQKRSSVATSGHFGFPEYAYAYEKELRELMLIIFGINEFKQNIAYTIFGEWAGPGVQQGVGISNIKEKSFFIFAASTSKTIDGGKVKEWEDISQVSFKPDFPRCYNVYNFGIKYLTIDFENPGMSQNELVELTKKIEEQCPVTIELGAEGIGEGVVWVGWYKGQQYRFKVKGEKHSESKVKTLASVDPEKLKKVSELIDYLITANRLEHALREVAQEKEITDEAVLDKRYTGDILRWIANDIIAEEGDTLVHNGLEWRDVAKQVSNTYRLMFFKIIEYTN